MMHLTRDPQTGVLSNQNTPIVLRGGHYHLFGADGGLKYWTGADGMPLRVCFPGEPAAEADGCSMDHAIQLDYVPWGTDRIALLDAVVNSGCNLLRVFLSDGVDLDDQGKVVSLAPFLQVNGKWQVAAAIRDNNFAAWNGDYFTRLWAFVAEADTRGVALQLCLFSHHDLRTDLDDAHHAYWLKSWWNPDNIDDPTWGAANLVSIDTSGFEGKPNAQAKLRNQDFLDTSRTGLMAVQRRIVERVLTILCPRANVIFELNNEPRILGDPDHAVPQPAVYQARWLDTATGWITHWLQAMNTTWRPLISANASLPMEGFRIDVDAWATTPELGSGYKALDAISYHGLTGLDPIASGEAHCGSTTLPAIGGVDVATRVTTHRGDHPTKALVFSTDAVRFFPQSYRDDRVPPMKIDLLRREGQVCTSLDYTAQVTPPTERARGDLDNWAYWVLRYGFGHAGDVLRTGREHFQNHSTTPQSLQAVGAAAAEAQGVPHLSRNVGSWGQRYERTSGGTANFWTAHRFHGALGEIVNQQGTQNPQQAANAQGLSAIGWRYDFTPATAGRFAFEVDYQVVSVSDVEKGGARVTPKVALTLYEAHGTVLGAQLGRVERVLAPHAPPGSLMVAAILAAGGQYAVVMTGEVLIAYTNRLQGYGETILRFVEMRLCGAP